MAPEVAEISEGNPREVVVENARRKARAVAASAPAGDSVLGADTEVVLADAILGKPADEEEAREFLMRLSGHTHEVYGGLCLIDRGEERTGHAVTRVRFRSLDRPVIDWYLQSGEWRDRAGAYAIQGRGAALVAEIEGDYLNVVGLPVALLLSRAFVPIGTHESSQDRPQ